MAGIVDLFWAFRAAEKDLQAAERICSDLKALWRAPGDDSARRAGAELAERRRRRAEERLRTATRAFTQGRPLALAIWSLPDEV